MTKLMEWLAGGLVILAVWLALITNKIETDFTREHMNIIWLSPIIFVLFFGIYAATVVLYRTLTFNNCEEAAVSLKKEIQMAREDLKSKGFKF